MANLTSSQSGNWATSSTWGGSTPADGDTFTIAQGHKVTVNSDQRAGTGFGNILVRGCLHFATNGKIRMNGRITVQGNASTDYSKSGGVSAQDFTEGGGSSGALLSATGNNIHLEFEGTDADQHGIWVENISYSSWKFIGDDSVTTTELSAVANTNDDYITVDSATGFGIGDWIAIYNNGHANSYAHNDEGLWVHDVDTSNNRIYVKKFVGPKAIVSSASGTSLVVDYTKIFRIGYKIIFGTGSNRNIKTITAINPTTNTLTLNSSISGTISSGTEVYETGLDKKHAVDCKVRKNSAVLTSAGAVGDTTVTVSDATDISVGDTINIDVNNDVDTNWDYNSEYSVTNKSGNTLTISPALEHVRKVGSLVQRLNRSITIEGVDTDVRAFCYVEYDTDSNRAGTREIGLKDIRWYRMGGNTNNSFYRGACMVAGYNSDYHTDFATNSRQDYQSGYQNCVVHDSNNKSNYTGMNSRHAIGFIWRNCVSVNAGERAYWQWSSHYNVQFVNNYGTRSSYATVDNGAMYDAPEYAYNYSTRSDDYAWLLHHMRNINSIHNNIFLNHEQRPFYVYYQSPGIQFRRMHFDGFRNIPYIGAGGGFVEFRDSYFQNKWYKQIPGTYAGYTDTFGVVDANDYLGNSGWDSRADYTRNPGFSMLSEWFDWNFEENHRAVVEAANLIWQENNDKIWTLINLRTEHALACQSHIVVPANTTVTITGEYKGQDSGSYTRPYLTARKANERWMGRYNLNDSSTFSVSSSTDVKNSNVYGFLEQTQFTTASYGAWEQKTLTLAAQKYSYKLITGYRIDSDNQEEIGYVKDLEITLGSKTKMKSRHFESRSIHSGASKKRISGRI